MLLCCVCVCQCVHVHCVCVWNYCILDEGHVIKNTKTKVAVSISIAAKVLSF